MWTAFLEIWIENFMNPSLHKIDNLAERWDSESVTSITRRDLEDQRAREESF